MYESTTRGTWRVMDTIAERLREGVATSSALNSALPEAVLTKHGGKAISRTSPRHRSMTKGVLSGLRARRFLPRVWPVRGAFPCHPPAAERMVESANIEQSGPEARRVHRIACSVVCSPMTAPQAPRNFEDTQCAIAGQLCAAMPLAGAGGPNVPTPMRQAAASYLRFDEHRFVAMPDAERLRPSKHGCGQRLPFASVGRQGCGVGRHNRPVDVVSNSMLLPRARLAQRRRAGSFTTLQKSTAFLHDFRTLLAGGQALSKPVEGRRTRSVAVPCTGKPRPRRPRRNGRGSCFDVRERIKGVEAAVAITAPPLSDITVLIYEMIGHRWSPLMLSTRARVRACL